MLRGRSVDACWVAWARGFRVSSKAICIWGALALKQSQETLNYFCVPQMWAKVLRLGVAVSITLFWEIRRTEGPYVSSNRFVSKRECEPPKLLVYSGLRHFRSFWTSYFWKDNLSGKLLRLVLPSHSGSEESAKRGSRACPIPTAVRSHQDENSSA